MSTNKQLTSDEFNEISSKINHKWMGVEQVVDFNLHNFIEIEIIMNKEKQGTNHIIVYNQQIHPEYKLEQISFYIDRDDETGDNPYITEHEQETMQAQRLHQKVSTSKDEHHFYIDIEDTDEIKIVALVTSKNEGLLDMELESIIDLYEINKTTD